MDVRTHNRAVRLGHYMMQIAEHGRNKADDLDVCNQIQAAVLDMCNCASVGIVFPNSCHISPNQACHAGLQNEYDGNYNCGSLATVSLIHDNEDLSYIEQRDYLQWLLNDSCYAHCFVDKDAAYTLRRGFIITRTDVPSNILMGGLIASRRVSEYTHVAKMFNMLRRSGMQSAELAYLIAHHVNSRTVRNNKGNLMDLNIGHTSVDISIMGKEAMNRFLDKTPFKINADYCDDWHYCGVDMAWCDADGDGYAGHFHEETPLTRIIHSHIDYQEIEQGKSSKPVRIGLNPFPLDLIVPQGIMVCLDKLIDKLCELEQTIIKEIRNV